MPVQREQARQAQGQLTQTLDATPGSRGDFPASRQLASTSAAYAAAGTRLEALIRCAIRPRRSARARVARRAGDGDDWPSQPRDAVGRQKKPLLATRRSLAPFAIKQPRGRVARHRSFEIGRSRIAVFRLETGLEADCRRRLTSTAVARSFMSFTPRIELHISRHRHRPAREHPDRKALVREPRVRRCWGGAGDGHADQGRRRRCVGGGVVRDRRSDEIRR